MNKKSMIVLIGPPCSGKGTQVGFFRNAGVKIISIGHILRTEYQSDPMVQNLINNGHMVPNTVIKDILRRKISADGSYLFDGYPRTTDQARDFIKLFPNDDIKIIVLKVDDKEIYRRMRNRYNCQVCGSVFSKNTSCCGIQAVQRNDDRDEFFKRRIEIYRSNCEEIIKILNKKAFFIDATQTPEQIFKQITKKIQLPS
jgi:adenylate kinase family enzyme